jgi:hypothetical protein
MNSRIRSLDEFYRAINNLIQSLAAKGFIEDSAKLNDLIHETSWTTSSELLGEVGLALRDMKGKYPSEVNKEIYDCHKFAVHHRKILALDS